MIEIFRIPVSVIPPTWPEIAALIAPAVEMAEGRHTLDTTRDRLMAEDMLALVGLRDARPVVACVVQIGLYPAQKWLQVPFCGGHDMRSWLEPLTDELDALAQEFQCVGIELSGRGGWQRALRRFGYEPSRNHAGLTVKRLEPAMARRAA